MSLPFPAFIGSTLALVRRRLLTPTERRAHPPAPPQRILYANVSYDDLVELSFDRIQQLRRDHRDDDAESAAWGAMLSRKRRETYGQA